MTLINPKNCTIGKTFFYAPEFLVGDFTVNSGGSFADPDYLALLGDSVYKYANKSSLPIAGLAVIASYKVQDGGNSNVVGSLATCGGVGLSPGTADSNPTNYPPSGAWLVAHYDTPHFIINDAASVEYESGDGESLTEYSVLVTMTVSDTPSGGYYSLTIDLQVPGMSIDHQEVITQAFADTETTLQLLAIGPTSPDGEEHPSYLNLETLYIVAASGLPRTCRGPVPQSSEVARDSTLHLSHAGIYKAVSGSAAQMHNEFKDAT